VGLVGNMMRTSVQVATTVAGIVPEVTADTVVVTVDASLQVKGIKTAGLRSGRMLVLAFTNACRVKNGATVGAGEAPFLLLHMGGVAQDINWNGSTPQTGGRIVVQYFETELPQSPCFALVGGPIS